MIRSPSPLQRTRSQRDDWWNRPTAASHLTLGGSVIETGQLRTLIATSRLCGTVVPRVAVTHREDVLFLSVLCPIFLNVIEKEGKG